MKKMVISLGILGLLLVGCSGGSDTTKLNKTISSLQTENSSLKKELENIETSSSETATSSENKIVIDNEKQFSETVDKANEKLDLVLKTLQGFIDKPETYTSANLAKLQLKLKGMDDLEKAISAYVDANGEDFKSEKVSDKYTAYQEKIIDMTDAFSKLPDEFSDK